MIEKQNSKLPTSRDAISPRWPINGEPCIIFYRGSHLFATWHEREGIAGGPGAWVYNRNGSFLAFHDQVDRWWSLTDAASIRTPPRCCKGWNCLMTLKPHEEEFCAECVEEMDRDEIRDEQNRRRYEP